MKRISIVIVGILSVLLVYNSCRTKVEKLDEETLIAIQPFEGFEKAYADTLEKTIEAFYGVKVLVLKDIKMPESFFVNVKSPRYRADSIIRFLKENEDYSGYDHVLGLSPTDISTTKYSDFSTKTIKEPQSKYADWGIFGLGYCPGPSCVVSEHRLQMGVSKEEFIARLKKVSCHELGHNFGLPHCPNKDCIMQDAAETIKTIDNVQLNLCEDCKKKLGMK